MSECSFEVGNLGRAVSPRPPTWANKFENLVQAFSERPPYLGFESCGLDRPRRGSGRYRWTVLGIQRRRARDSPLPRLRPRCRPRRWSGQVGVEGEGVE
jgi:hypothetical protein